MLLTVPRPLSPPLFVKPDEPLFIQDPDRARRGVEWQDLEDGSYPGFDVDGRPFVLEAVTDDRKLLGFVPYRRGEVALRVLDGDARPHELRELLIDALDGRAGTSRPELDRLSLAELQAMAITYYGFSA